MRALIDTLEVHNFRGLQHLRVERFGQVNLITGKNNAGKSTLLEALRLLSSGGDPSSILELLAGRDELFSAGSYDEQGALADSNPTRSLFFGFPAINECKAGFSIEASGQLPPSAGLLRVRIDSFIRRVDPTSATISYEPAEADLLSDSEGEYAIEITTRQRSRFLRMAAVGERRIRRVSSESPPIPSVYLDPFSSRSTGQMGALWDAVALTDVEKEVVEALKVITPDISAVTMVGGLERSARGRAAIARSVKHHVPVPLRSFGDGVNRLFGIILSLCNAKDGVFLVDEIENGLHFSVQAEIWRSIFRLARSLNVQVFATTHSWDCVQAFQLAAQESPEAGVLVRLDRRDDYLYPTVFSERELEIVTRDQIEVR